MTPSNYGIGIAGIFSLIVGISPVKIILTITTISEALVPKNILNNYFKKKTNFFLKKIPIY